MLLEGRAAQQPECGPRERAGRVPREIRCRGNTGRAHQRRRSERKTRHELADTDDLHMWLDVNGRRFQSGSTRTMIFKPAFVIHYLSQFMSLQPGDIISTGTPPGVGLGQKPPIYLNVGDTITLGITGLGTQRQVVVDFQMS